MAVDQQPYKGSARARQSDVYGAVPYLPPERVSHYHEQPSSSLPLRDVVVRLLGSIVLAALGIVSLIAGVRAAVALADLSANPGMQPDWSSAGVGFAGPALLTLLFFAYPTVNVVRLLRARRR